MSTLLLQEGSARALIRALNLGQMEHARQPGAGWRGAKVLAQVLIHRAGKVFSSSADLFFVSRFPSSADVLFVGRFRPQIALVQEYRNIILVV